MGCDIHTYVEQQQENGAWEPVKWESGDGWDTGPFDWRDYDLFGWLADVRNSAAVPPLADPRGLPADASQPVRDAHEDMGYDAHSGSWFAVSELAEFDYAATFEYRRYRRQTGPKSWDGAATAEPGNGKQQTYRETFGDAYFRDLATLTAMNAVRPTRVVFWFGN